MKNELHAAIIACGVTGLLFWIAQFTEPFGTFEWVLAVLALIIELKTAKIKVPQKAKNEKWYETIFRWFKTIFKSFWKLVEFGFNLTINLGNIQICKIISELFKLLLERSIPFWEFIFQNDVMATVSKISVVIYIFFCTVTVITFMCKKM